ncbi:MAG: hypothetical protein KDA89_13195 [Planctomycetaceae bacterium]|nr:hypothetical protein [Planctomycetaceae bacterium]
MADNRHNTPMSDEQTDELLRSFFSAEVPVRLEVVPSAWPELAEQAQQAAVARENSRPTPAARRTVVAAAALAACLTLAVLSSNVLRNDTTGSGSGTSVRPLVGQTSENPGAVPDEEKLMPVHGGSEKAAVDDRNTTLEELDGIEIMPQPETSGNK